MINEADKNILVRFGKHLKTLRQAQKLTFRKMGTRCNIDYSDIQKFESGKINITLLTIIELAKALDVEPKELLNFFND